MVFFPFSRIKVVLLAETSKCAERIFFREAKLGFLVFPRENTMQTGYIYSSQRIEASRTEKLILSSKMILLSITGNIIANPSCSITCYLLHLNHSVCLNLNNSVSKLWIRFVNYIRDLLEHSNLCLVSICVLICSCNVYYNCISLKK